MNEFIKSKNNDELYTPRYLVEPMVPYIPKNKIIWCPFDTEDSNYVKVFKEKGFDVICSHKREGKDFFYYKPEKFDIIISNPPFSLKLEVLKRLWYLDCPFAILLPLPCLNYQEIGNFFVHNKGLQLMIFDKKVSFDGNTASFNTSYFCKNFLGRDLIFHSLLDNNSGKYFRDDVNYENKNYLF